MLSDRYRVRRLGRDDVPALLSLCGGNPMYYRYCPPEVTEQSILRDMEALPPGKQASGKYYLGYFDGDRLIAVLDLIASWPDESTAFIGFFMTDASVQNRGIGSGIIDDLCACLLEAGFSEVRLGWVKGNPQAARFWQKNGFAETGITYETDRYSVVAARRILRK